jgi:hypothetical protein
MTSSVEVWCIWLAQERAQSSGGLLSVGHPLMGIVVDELLALHLALDPPIIQPSIKPGVPTGRSNARVSTQVSRGSESEGKLHMQLTGTNI